LTGTATRSAAWHSYAGHGFFKLEINRGAAWTGKSQHGVVMHGVERLGLDGHSDAKHGMAIQGTVFLN